MKNQNLDLEVAKILEDAPSSRKALRENYDNLLNVADYCCSNYTQVSSSAPWGEHWDSEPAQTLVTRFILNGEAALCVSHSFPPSISWFQFATVLQQDLMSLPPTPSF